METNSPNRRNVSQVSAVVYAMVRLFDVVSGFPKLKHRINFFQFVVCIVLHVSRRGSRLGPGGPGPHSFHPAPSFGADESQKKMRWKF